MKASLHFLQHTFCSSWQKIKKIKYTSSWMSKPEKGVKPQEMELLRADFPCWKSRLWPAQAASLGFRENSFTSLSRPQIRVRGENAEQQVAHNWQSPTILSCFNDSLAGVKSFFPPLFITTAYAPVGLFRLQEHGILFSFSFKILLTLPQHTHMHTPLVFLATKSLQCDIVHLLRKGFKFFVKLAYHFCQLCKPHSFPFWKTIFPSPHDHECASFH